MDGAGSSLMNVAQGAVAEKMNNHLFCNSPLFCFQIITAVQISAASELLPADPDMKWI